MLRTLSFEGNLFGVDKVGIHASTDKQQSCLRSRVSSECELRVSALHEAL